MQSGRLCFDLLMRDKSPIIKERNPKSYREGAIVFAVCTTSDGPRPTLCREGKHGGLHNTSLRDMVSFIDGVRFSFFLFFERANMLSKQGEPRWRGCETFALNTLIAAF